MKNYLFDYLSQILLFTLTYFLIQTSYDNLSTFYGIYPDNIPRSYNLLKKNDSGINKNSTTPNAIGISNDPIHYRIKTDKMQATVGELLRSYGQATNQSLLDEKAGISINVNETSAKETARMAASATTFDWCIEAEQGTGNRSIANNSLASGGQFMGRFGNSTQYMEYTIPDVPAEGAYVLRLRYSSGETPQLGIMVNRNLQIVDGINNGNWAGPFAEKTVAVHLQAGTNTLRIQGAERNFVLDQLYIKAEEATCTAPSLVLTTSGCNGSSTYSVGFSAQAGANVSSSAGTVQGNQVVNVPVGTNVTITASLGGCSAQRTANSPTCGPSCTPPSLVLTTSGCNGSSTYSVGFSAQAGANVSSSAGTVQGNQVVNIPVGTNVTITASLGGCSAQRTANSPTCGPSCTPPSLALTTSGCNGSSTYSVGFSAQAGANVSSSAGTVQGNQVVNVPVGTNVTITARLGGCSAQKTANSPTCGSSGGGSGYNYPIPVTPASWPSYNSDVLSGKTIGETAVLENEYLKVEVRKNYGGAIQIIDKASGKKLVNFADWGRENELSIYSGPKDFSANGWGDFNQIGWNPLTVGDIYGNGAPILGWGFVRGNDGLQRIYVRTRMINWPTNNTLMDAYNERWYGLNGREIDVKARVTFNRSDQNFYEPPVPQEYPCFMRSGKNTLRYYTGNAPYTNAPYTTTNNTEVDGKAFGGGHFMISEPWISQEQSGLHIFVNTDKLALTSHTGYDYQYDNTDYEGAFQATYATPANWLVVDPRDIWYHNYGFYVTNSFQEGRTWANARPRKYGDKPDFRFDATRGRNDWRVGKGYDQGQPFSGDGWNCTFVPSQDGGPLTARRSSICSPFGSWKASTISTIYIRMKYTGQENQFRVSFRRNGQSEIPYNSKKPNQFAAWYPNGLENPISQSFTFTPIKDGQYHTYVINCAANPEWRDIIQYFQINYGNGNEVIPQETISLMYFGVNNPGN